MARTAEQVEAEALQLNADERARLAEHILASLESQPTEDPKAIEAAWLDEANRRYEEYLRGNAEPIPAKQVFDELLPERD